MREMTHMMGFWELNFVRLSTHKGNSASFRDVLGLELQPDQNKHEIRLNQNLKIYFYYYFLDKIYIIYIHIYIYLSKMNGYFVFKYIY